MRTLKKILKTRLLKRWNCVPAQMLQAPPRHFLAQWYLSGEGIEIGPLHLPLPLPPEAQVRYVDHMSLDTLKREFPELGDLPIVEPDVIDDGQKLERFPSKSLDFIVANHFLEHCEDPIGTLRTFHEKLKIGGRLFMAVPDKRYTFDRERPVTPLSHLIADHENGPEGSRRGHYEEWARYAYSIDDEAERRKAVEDLMAKKLSIHFHVWTASDVLELLVYLIREQGMAWEILATVQHGEESVFVLEATS